MRVGASPAEGVSRVTVKERAQGGREREEKDSPKRGGGGGRDGR